VLNKDKNILQNYQYLQSVYNFEHNKNPQPHSVVDLMYGGEGSRTPVRR